MALLQKTVISFPLYPLSQKMVTTSPAAGPSALHHPLVVLLTLLKVHSLNFLQLNHLRISSDPCWNLVYFRKRKKKSLFRNHCLRGKPGPKTFIKLYKYNLDTKTANLSYSLKLWNRQVKNCHYDK